MRRSGPSVCKLRPGGGVASLVVALIFASCATPLLGQNSVGVQIGLSSSSLGGDPPTAGELTSRTGLVAGVSAEIDIGGGLYLIAQPQFVGRGSGVAFAVKGEPEPRDSLLLSLDYITVPLGLKVVSRSERFYVSSVLDLGVLTRANLNDGSTDTDVKDAIKNLDLAVGLGVGTSFSLGRPFMTVELRYWQSISNLTAEDAAIGEGGFPRRFRASGMQLVGGLFFSWGGDR